MYSSLIARFVPVGIYICRIYSPPNRKEEIIPRFGRQIVKITRAIASQPRSPNALLLQMPPA